MATPSRPLSPHLMIYKMQMTMAMSIVHRITGMGLYFGAALLVLWLLALALGGDAQTFAQMIAASWFGQIVLFLMVWALFHHMLGGLRHFIWDFGKGFERGARFGFAWATLIGGFVLAALVWLIFVIL